MLLVASCYRNWNKCWPNRPLGTYADFTSTSELPFASFFSEQVLVLNVSREKDLIFVRMNIQVTYIFIPIVSHKDSFCHRGKRKLGIGLFIHELLREPLISYLLESSLNYLTFQTVRKKVI